jgi:hypothetical protein
MPAVHRLGHRCSAVIVVLIVMLALPGLAIGRPADESTGPRSQLVAEPATPAPTVVRTVIKEDTIRALPIALAGAALLIAIGGTSLALVRIAPMRHQLR